MSNSFYSVVEFDDHSVEAVPTHWLNKEMNMCSWPGGVGTGKLIRSGAQPQHNWEKYVCVVLKTCRKYLRQPKF